MFGPVETKLDELTSRRFINCVSGTGKTVYMLGTINSILEKGETCLLITPSTFGIRDLFPERKLPEGLSVLHIDKLLKYLKRYPMEKNPYTQKEPYFIPRQFVELFTCQRIVIDPDCYIKMIEQYIERLNKLDKIIEQIQKV